MKKQNKLLKLQLIIQSFAPLYLLVLIRYFDHHVLTSCVKLMRALVQREDKIFLRVWTHPYFGVTVVSFMSICWIISAMIAFWQLKDAQHSGFIDGGDKIAIEEQLTESGITFFMTFIFPLLLDDLTTFRGLTLFIGILILVFLLLWKTNLYYQNPVLTILGYKVYRIHFQKESGGNPDEKYIAISKYPLNESKIVKWKPIADNVLLMYNKNA